MPNKYSRNAILQQNLKAIRLGHQSKKLIYYYFGNKKRGARNQKWKKDYF